LPNPYDLDSNNDGMFDLVENGLNANLDLDNNGVVDCSSNCDPDGDGILTLSMVCQILGKMLAFLI
jgi:hypothetical protein